MRSRLALPLASLALPLLALVPALPAAAGDPPPGFTDAPVATGLSAPTSIAFLPDGRMLVGEKGGELSVVSGGVRTPLVTIPVCTASEMGLLGIAVDPDFGSNGFVYLYRTESNGGCGDSSTRSNEIVRVTMSGSSINLGSLTVLLTGIRTDGGNHDGGAVRIGPDGKLYAGVGDTGIGDNQGCPGSATNPYSQDLNALEGKVLRLNLDGSIPADNPFFGQVGKRGEIFAYGFRNPFRFDFDPVSGNLWLGEVGDLAFEEIDVVTAGGNYGWPACEAGFPAGCPLAGQIGPIFTYSHGGGCPGEGGFPSLGSSISGGTFATGTFGGFGGHYFFGDYTGGRVYRAEPNGTRDGIIGSPVTFVDSAGGPVDFAFACDALFYVDIFAGEVRRVAPASGGGPALSGKKLLLKDRIGNPSKKGLVASSKDASIDLGGGNGSADDPVLNGGSQLVVSSAGFNDTYPLPAANFA